MNQTNQKIVELKSAAYDSLAMIEFHQGRLKQINSEIKALVIKQEEDKKSPMEVVKPDQAKASS